MRLHPFLLVATFLSSPVLAAPVSSASSHHHPHGKQAHHIKRKIVASHHASASVPMTWAAQMSDFLHKCDPSITADQISRVVDRCQEIMASRGVSESRLSILSHVDSSIPSGVNLGMHPADPFALYVTLRAPSQ